MRELAALATELGTTDRTLRRAIADGLIHAERPTPRTVQLTPGERAYLRRNWDRLARLRSLLRTEPNVETAVLFGSVARGTDHPGSDVDLLVVLRRDSPLASGELAARLHHKLDVPVQITRLSPALRSPTLLAEVLRDGRVLVQRGDAWRKVQRRAHAIDRAAGAELASELEALVG